MCRKDKALLLSSATAPKKRSFRAGLGSRLDAPRPPWTMRAPHLRMRLLLASLLTVVASAQAEIRVPAFTAYGDPLPDALRVSSSKGITGWSDPAEKVVWFGEIKTPGKLTAVLSLSLKKDGVTKLRLTVAGVGREATATGTGAEQTLDFGEFMIAKPGYMRFELTSLNAAGTPAGDLASLVIDGPATTEAHFNLEARRNAASVHLHYPTPKDAHAEWFYNEVTAVEDPVYTFYMACGFSRGYFGMQVNGPNERRVIFSVWDSGAGGNAKDRSKVAPEDQVQLLAKGDGVEASVFGNEGTGGHSHLVYPWKTGEAQRFLLAARVADAAHTEYSGYWFHPEKKAWMLIASFRAPKDGGLLRGLHSFSENFGGSNGHLVRKARYGNQWIRTVNGAWTELTEASFTHDETGKSARLDRFMGVEEGRFFLSHGGFVPGFSKYAEKFTRPATGKPPTGITLPEAK